MQSQWFSTKADSDIYTPTPTNTRRGICNIQKPFWLSQLGEENDTVSSG